MPSPYEQKRCYCSKKDFLEKQKNYTATTDQHNQKQANTLVQQTFDECEDFAQLCNDYANEFENTENMHASELKKPIAEKRYTIIDKNGIECTLTPSQHLVLMDCETYKLWFNELGQVNFSNQYAPASATQENILTLINCIENKKDCDFFELANYLEADTKFVTDAAEKFYSTLKAKDKNNLSFEEKRLKKIAKRYLFYETLQDFLKDYRAKKGTVLKIDYHHNDLSHRSLKKLGFYKKIKSLEGLEEFIDRSARDDEFEKFLDSRAQNEVKKISDFDISGHAITDFTLNGFYLRGFLFDRINLSNNKIEKLTAEQLQSDNDVDRKELILDNNPITEIHNCTNFTKMPKLLDISLKNILLAKEMLQNLPPLETAAWDKAVRKCDYLSTNYPVTTLSMCVASVLSSIFSSMVMTDLLHDYLIKKGLLKTNLLSDSLRFFHRFINSLTVSGSLVIIFDKLFKQAESNQSLTKFTTDYGVHLLKKN